MAQAAAPRPALSRCAAGGRAACVLAALLWTSTMAMAENPTDVAGRWVPSRERPQVLPDYPIDIAPCPDALCGRAVHIEGSCGPVMMRLRPAGGGSATGHIQIGQWTAIVVERAGDRLTIRVAPQDAGGPAAQAGTLLGSYGRQGPSACPPGDPFGDTPWFARPSAPRP